jgi:hypothetical protein
LTQDEIIEIIRQAGGFDALAEFLERFAKLVAAKEREACAKLCVTQAENPSVLLEEQRAWIHAAENCAFSIKARGQA